MRTVASSPIPAAHAEQPGDRPVEDADVSLRRQIVVGFLLVFFVFCASPNVDSGDGFSITPTAHSLLYEQNLELSEFRNTPWFDHHYGVAQIEGRRQTYFPWLSAVFAVPTVALWDGLSVVGVTSNSSDQIDAGTVGTLQVVGGSLSGSLAAVVLALTTRRLFQLMGERAPDRKNSGRQVSNHLLSAESVFGRWSVTFWIVVLGLGTSLWSVASRSVGQHAPSVLLGGTAVLLLTSMIGQRPLPHRVLSGTALGAVLALAYWERPTNLVLTLVAVAVIGVCRRRVLLPLLGGLAATHVMILAANVALVGRAIPPYFAGGRVGWHDEYIEAMAANVISPGRGLVLFSPFLLGAILLALPSRSSLMPRDLRVYTLAAGSGALGYLLIVSGFEESWWAGLSYGPRFMTESVVLLGPLALLGLFGPTRSRVLPDSAARALAGLLIVASVVIHGGGAVSPEIDCWNARHGDASDGVWSWSDPQALAAPKAVVAQRDSVASSTGCVPT